MKHKSMSQMNREKWLLDYDKKNSKRKELKLKPFWKKPLLVTKKTITKDPKYKDTSWVELDVYNPYKEKGNNGNKSS